MVAKNSSAVTPNPDAGESAIRRETLLLERAKAELELQEARDAAERGREERIAAADEKRAADVAAEKEAASAKEKAAKDAAEKLRLERQKAAAANLTAVATGLGNLTGSTLTVPEKSVFREALVARIALGEAAERVAATVQGAVGSARVLVTARTDQAETALASLSFAASVRDLLYLADQLLDKPVDGKTDVIALVRRAPDEPVEADDPGAVATPATIGAAAVALGVAAINALSIETTVDATEHVASELETHVAVIGSLLDRGVDVVHETIGLPALGNALDADFRRLQRLLPELDAQAAFWSERIGERDKEKEKDLIEQLKGKKAMVEALAARITAFIAAANEKDTATGSSPLHAALRGSALLGGGNEDPKFIAVVTPARIDAHQIALKRRLFAPRLIIAASAAIDLVVLDVTERRLRAATTQLGEAAFQVRFPMWWWGADESYVPKYRPLNTAVFPDPATSTVAPQRGVEQSTQFVAHQRVAPANWYPDPHQTGQLRWWTGSEWSAHTHPG